MLKNLKEAFPDVIRSERMDLVPVTRESLLCQMDEGPHARKELSAVLDASVPEEWPPEHWEPHVVDYLLKLIAEHPDAVGWCRYLLLRRGTGRVLIGTFGCTFPKPETGEAELGYGVLPSWQRQGFAAEAVMAMMPWLRMQRAIHAFVAQTFPSLYGSVRVLEKCGFVSAGAGEEPGAILFRKTINNIV
ncbi:GNAT family N-acetyltransferase [Acidicapsa dinghuensis]|uniref:GNAT family N-acetyltransferase n=1 Tax=Acidicapsa dinghuensis TaxID=2218256 RepID=A0ABW1EN66_9BACT|nr:GNAT family N-acetyltransferase [Acidicapsa dinghuensis]